MEFEAKDYQEALDGLAFDDEAIARIAGRLQSAASATVPATATATPAPLPVRRRSLRPLARAAAIVAVALAIALCSGAAYAAATGTDLSGLLVSMLRWAQSNGGTGEDVPQSADEAQASDAVVLAGQSVSSGGATMTFEGSYGSGNDVTAVFSLVKDDGSAFEEEAGQSEESDELGFASDPFGDGFDFTTTRDYGIESTSLGVNYADESRTKVVVEVGIRASQDLSGLAVRLDFTNLQTTDESGNNPDVLAEGVWSFDFVIDLSNMLELEAGQIVTYDGCKLTLTSVSVLPVGVAVSYTMSYDDATSSLSAPCPPVSIVLRDGSEIKAMNNGLTGQGSSGSDFHAHLNMSFPGIIDVSEVAAVKIDDVILAIA